MAASNGNTRQPVFQGTAGHVTVELLEGLDEDATAGGVGEGVTLDMIDAQNKIGKAIIPLELFVGLVASPIDASQQLFQSIHRTDFSRSQTSVALGYGPGQGGKRPVAP